jgi:hypothetical protein
MIFGSYDIQAIRLFVKEAIEKNARVDIVVNPDLIRVVHMSKNHLWFNDVQPCRGEMVDMIEKIDSQWIASYWDNEQKRGVQLIVSSSAFSLEETGSLMNVETWWPLFEKPA